MAFSVTEWNKLIPSKWCFCPIQVCKVVAQCLNNDWQFDKATCKFNSNFLDQVVKFRLSLLLTRFAVIFFWHKLKQHNFCGVPEIERKKTPLEPTIISSCRELSLCQTENHTSN